MATVCCSLAFVAAVDYLYFTEGKISYGQIHFSLQSQKWFTLSVILGMYKENKCHSKAALILVPFWNIGIGAIVKYYTERDM